MQKLEPKVAYFSMGIYLESYLPTYSGGLEILIGDGLRSCADLGIPAIGIVQASNNGYFRQRIGEDGTQREEPVYWAPHKTLPRIDKTVIIKHKGRPLRVGAELYEIEGKTGFRVPVYLLDTNFDYNFRDKNEDDRSITGILYDGRSERRIAQENVLGQAGVKLVRALGYDSIETFHMNEGHACFATLELLAENGYNDEDVRKHCVLTTHTTMDAGHDVWPYDMVRSIVGDEFLPWHIKKLAGENDFNTTRLAMNLSRHVNAVSKRHAEVCEEMPVFKGRKVPYITNGVHPETWTVLPMAELYDRHFRYWRIRPKVLENAVDRIPAHELSAAKDKAKRYLIGYINANNPVKLNQDALTIVWARRFTDYKRPLLLFRDIDKLYKLADTYGQIQLVFSGKSHPADEKGKELIQDIQEVIRTLKKLNGNVKGVFIEDYNPEIARRLLGGADVWLNTPRRPLEASGSSGMKALFNACLNLSTYDGWIVEAFEMDPEAIWIIGPKINQVTVNPDCGEEDRIDAEGLYDGLEQILNIFYKNKNELARRRAHSVGLSSWFNSHRMVSEYAEIWGIEASEFL